MSDSTEVKFNSDPGIYGMSTPEADQMAKKLKMQKRFILTLLEERVKLGLREAIEQLQSEAVFALSEKEVSILGPVTNYLRNEGFKFRFIEVQDQSGDVLEHKLAVSFNHLMG